MPVTKTEEFRKVDVRIARIARALGHPARVAILRELARRNSCVCGEIVDAIPLAQATVSQHLKELKEIGMIAGTIDGPKTCYCIDPEAMNDLARVLKDFLASLHCSCVTSNCCDH